MKVVMRGCRGSTPVPGFDTLKYGGNTTCIEVVTRAGDHLLFDAGTGIRQSGLDMNMKSPVRCAIFISHAHWAHIQGLPFFVPLFVPGSKVNIYGGFDPVYHKSLAEVLSQQMQYCYFPVREAELKADITYTSLPERESVQYGSATVTNIVLSHPVLNYGYKVEADGRTLFFTGDYEPSFNIFDESESEFEDYAGMVAMRRNVLVDFLSGVDVLIMDAQYTDEEYRGKAGWGHGTYAKCIELAEAAGIPRLYLTHHDPTRTDAALDRIYADILAGRREGNTRPEIIMARESLSFEV